LRHNLADKGVIDMTVEEYRVSLGWSVSELARRAGLSTKTINRVEDGEPVYDHTVGAIARAFSEGLGRTITIRDLDGVNIANK
jgi:transcriptional regulator with XRE-family HTH domain